MTDFTPAPWTVVIVRGSYKQPYLIQAAGRTVAQCLGNQLEPDATSIREAGANANLIAAAPDLYKALVDVMAFAGKTANGIMWHFDDQQCAKKAFAAIAKARGDA